MLTQKFTKTKPCKGVLLNTGHPLAKGLVGYWLMNEGGGNKVFDLSGNGNTGTFAGDTKWVPGKFGSCLSFDGDEDHVSIAGFVADEQIGSLSVSFWIKAPGAVATDEYPFGHYQNSNNWGWRWRYEPDDELHFDVRSETPLQDGARIYNSLSDAKWHHIVGVYNGSNIYVYKDAVVSIDVGSLTGLTDQAFQALTIGTLEAGAYAFNGSIDNVMIFDRALTAQEIQQLYREPFCMFDKARLWGVAAEEEANAVFFGTEF